MEHLNLEMFEKFIKKYRRTYGQSKMTDDEAVLFYERVINVDPVQFEAVNKELLESYMRPYKQSIFLERVNIMFPSKDAQKAIEDGWKLDSEADPNKDKKLIHAEILSCIPTLVKNNPDGWRDDYFNKVHELFGEIESMEIATKIQFQFPEFKNWIYEKTKKEGK